MYIFDVINLYIMSLENRQNSMEWEFNKLVNYGHAELTYI